MASQQGPLSNRHHTTELMPQEPKLVQRLENNKHHHLNLHIPGPSSNDEPPLDHVAASFCLWRERQRWPNLQRFGNRLFLRGSLCKFVTNCVPKLRRFSCWHSFRTSHGCAELSQSCRTFEGQFGHLLCKSPFSNAPFSKFMGFCVFEIAAILGRSDDDMTGWTLRLQLQTSNRGFGIWFAVWSQLAVGRHPPFAELAEIHGPSGHLADMAYKRQLSPHHKQRREQLPSEQKLLPNKFWKQFFRSGNLKNDRNLFPREIYPVRWRLHYQI